MKGTVKLILASSGRSGWTAVTVAQGTFTILGGIGSDSGRGAWQEGTLRGQMWAEVPGLPLGLRLARYYRD